MIVAHVHVRRRSCDAGGCDGDDRMTADVPLELRCKREADVATRRARSPCRSDPDAESARRRRLRGMQWSTAARLRRVSLALGVSPPGTTRSPTCSRTDFCCMCERRLYSPFSWSAATVLQVVHVGPPNFVRASRWIVPGRIVRHVVAHAYDAPERRATRHDELTRRACQRRALFDARDGNFSSLSMRMVPRAGRTALRWRVRPTCEAAPAVIVWRRLNTSSSTVIRRKATPGRPPAHGQTISNPRRSNRSPVDRSPPSPVTSDKRRT
jgi:hypothetical protein